MVQMELLSMEIDIRNMQGLPGKSAENASSPVLNLLPPVHKCFSML